MLYWHIHFKKWNPNQFLTYSRDVNTYIGFWTLKMKCTQYGLYGQEAFKNARIMQGLGDRGYDFFRWCLCPPPWRVQHSSEVFRETLLSRGRMGMPTEHICTYPYIYIYVFSVCITILTKTPLNWALNTHRNPGQIISHQTRTIDEMSPQILFPSCPVGPLTSHMPLASFYSASLQLNGVF